MQDQYVDIQLCDNHLIYSIGISKYSAIISEIFILTYFNTLDSEAEYSDIIVQYLDIRTEYIRCSTISKILKTKGYLFRTQTCRNWTKLFT